MLLLIIIVISLQNWQWKISVIFYTQKPAMCC